MNFEVKAYCIGDASPLHIPNEALPKSPIQPTGRMPMMVGSTELALSAILWHGRGKSWLWESEQRD